MAFDWRLSCWSTLSKPNSIHKSYDLTPDCAEWGLWFLSEQRGFYIFLFSVFNSKPQTSFHSENHIKPLDSPQWGLCFLGAAGTLFLLCLLLVLDASQQTKLHSRKLRFNASRLSSVTSVVSLSKKNLIISALFFFVCLSAELRKNYWTDFYETMWKGVEREPFKFWSGSKNHFSLSLTLQGWAFGLGGGLCSCFRCSTTHQTQFYI